MRQAVQQWTHGQRSRNGATGKSLTVRGRIAVESRSRTACSVIRTDIRYPLGTTALQDLTGRIGKYEIVRPLGRGAMGVVYLAHDTVLERDVALKVMVATIADDPVLRERFEREAKAVARMRHPNVVNVFDLGRHTDNSPYIAMELLRGRDLKQTLAEDASLSLDRKLGVIAQVLGGLAHAHEAGIVHRDIKPANVFITDDGTVKLMDFGVARLGNTTMTGGGGIVGTADYMAPEQVKGGQVDGRSDVFSVGCMLFELVAGEPPFHAGNVMAILYKISHEEPGFARLPAGAVYEDLRPILAKALSKDPARRHQTAYELAADLATYLGVHGTTPAGRRARQDLLRLAAPRVASRTAVAAEEGTDDTAVPKGRAEQTTVAPRATAAERGPRGGVRLAMAAGVAAVVAGGLAVIFWPRPKPDPPPEIRASAEPEIGGHSTETPTSPPPTDSPSPSPLPTKGVTRAEAVNALLVRAALELSRNPRKAKLLYEQALALDPKNENAIKGYRAASALADGGDPVPIEPRRRSFVTSATRTSGPGAASARLPGKIQFEVSPKAPSPGRAYTVAIAFRNEGTSPVEIATLHITTVLNGGRMGGPVPLLVRTVGSRESAVLRRMDGSVWSEEYRSWSMEAKVTTSNGETYVGELVWK